MLAVTMFVFSICVLSGDISAGIFLGSVISFLIGLHPMKEGQLFSVPNMIFALFGTTIGITIYF